MSLRQNELFLPEEFRALRRYENDPPQPTDDVELIATEQDCKQFFDEAKAIWIQKFSFFDFVEKLLIIAKAVKTEESEQQVLQIIEEISGLRKIGIILESAYMLFDESHYCPTEIYALMRLLGKLKDEANKRKKRKKITLIVLEHLIANHEFFCNDLGFRPSSAESFRSYFNKLVSEITAYLYDGLTAKDYHKLRKRIRRVMNTYQLMAAKTKDISATAMFQFIHSLDAQMGDLHDDFLEKLSPEDYHSKTIVIPREILEKLLHLIKILKKD